MAASPLLPPLPRSLSLLDADRLVARENARGGSDRAAHGASACRIAPGRRRSMQRDFLHKSLFSMEKGGHFSGQGRDEVATRLSAAQGVAARAHALAAVRRLHLRTFRH